MLVNPQAISPIMLATAEGRWVPAHSAEFLAALGDPNPDYDALGYAVRNLGFIQVQTIGETLTEVQLHPRNVQLPALLAVQQHLVGSQTRLFRVKYLDGEWCSESWISPEQVIARLSELCAPAFSPPVTKRFWAEAQDFGALFHDEDNQLRPLAQKWRVAFGHFDPNLLTIAMQNQVLSRLMIVGIKPNRKEAEWRFIGSGHLWLGDSYHLTGIGEKVVNMPDKDYGAWAAEYYTAVALSGQPRFDLVTAEVSYQGETDAPRRIVHYERLMLPWKTPSSEVLVTMCSRTLSREPVAGSDSAGVSAEARNAAKST
jgi:hypothetical protein